VSGPVSLQSFRILKTQQTKWRGFRFSFYALAVSHAVSLECEDQQLTEFLSCVPIKTEARILKKATASRLPWEITSRISSIRYSCRLSLAESSEGDALRCDFEGEHQIAACYPANPGLPTPVTRIGWRIEPSQAFVETIHSYPEENRVVRSESVFRFSPD
jgi:hypothetical protein